MWVFKSTLGGTSGQRTWKELWNLMGPSCHHQTMRWMYNRKWVKLNSSQWWCMKGWPPVVKCSLWSFYDSRAASDPHYVQTEVLHSLPYQEVKMFNTPGFTSGKRWLLSPHKRSLMLPHCQELIDLLSHSSVIQVSHLSCPFVTDD